MINLFQIASQDASINYLGRIFGSMSGVIHSPNGEQFGAINILSTMFKVFNGTVLSIAVLMLVYVTVVGVISTAHEGEFMGKKWNNIWIPIRAVLGFALLVPTGAGYCTLQIIMMWVIVQGIGAADVIWNTALNYMNQVGGPFPQIVLPSVTPQSNLPKLFQGLACDASMRFDGGHVSGNNGKYYCVSHTGAPCSKNPSPTTFTPKGNTFPISGGTCGTLTFADSATACQPSSAGGPPGNTTLGCEAAKQQAQALQSIVPVLSGIAISLVKADADYRDFYLNSGTAGIKPKAEWAWINQYCSANGISPQNCCFLSKAQALLAAHGGGKQCVAPKGGYPLPDINQGQDASNRAVTMYWQYYPELGPSLGKNTPFINTSVNYYMDNIQNAFTTWLTTQAQNPASQGEMKDIAATGWILAGAYYFKLASQNSKAFSQALPSMDFKAPDLNVEYRNNFSAAQALVAASQAGQGPGGGGGGPGTGGSTNPALVPFKLFSTLPGILGVGYLDDTISNALTSVNQNVGSLPSPTRERSGTVSKGSNPLAKLAMTGTIMLTVASVVFSVLLVLTGILAIAGNITPSIFGNFISNAIGPAWQTIMIFLMPLLYGMIGMLFTIGGMLAVYVPLIPFVVFAFGAIHWLISVVETMVAGPLVALGIISPSGQHELLGKAEPALMLIFNVFLRPTLMVFGLIAAMLLASVVQTMIDTGYAIVRDTGLTQNGLVLFIALFAYMMITVAALNKCFSLINILPSQVMRWIGGQGENVEVPMQEMKAGVEQGAGIGAGGAAASREIGSAATRERVEMAKGAQAAKAKAGEGMEVGGGKGGGGAPPPGGGGGAST